MDRHASRHAPHPPPRWLINAVFWAFAVIVLPVFGACLTLLFARYGEPIGLLLAIQAALVLNAATLLLWWAFLVTIGRAKGLRRAMFWFAVLLLLIGARDAMSNDQAGIGLALITTGLSGVAVMARRFDELWA